MKLFRLVGLVLGVFLASAFVRADDAAPAKIDFVEQKLPNGLRVIYAPLRQAPVVHVRVLYHVGSRDERPDRQGFAHMFEHMMFRGSAHVAAEEHMKLINSVGGDSNAFTSFDQTTYHESLPAEHLEMALYLEADRMASFKVNDAIYHTERNVVAKEWGIRQNSPYGTLFDDFLGLAFTKHSYRWTPIGNMDHLKAAPVSELQAFFNKYYVPNNAVLVIAGDIDIAKTQAMVEKYFAWIPAGPDIQRDIPAEPEQTKVRQEIVKRVVPLPAVVLGLHTPAYGSDDYYALSVVGALLGDGRTSRLDRRLVSNDQPLCADVSAGAWRLQDSGLFILRAKMLPGKKADDVRAVFIEELQKLLKGGITPAELDKARIQARKEIVESRKTAEDLATQLGESELFTGNAGRVNEEWTRLNALSIADVNAVARKYLDPDHATIMEVAPDPLGAATRQAAAAKTSELAKAPVTTSESSVEPRHVEFPAGYPQQPPRTSQGATAEFKKGVETNVHGVRVIVMTDHRLPLVNWNLTLRRGSHLDPVGKEGLGQATASLLRRGSVNLPYDQLNEDLESRAISIEVGDGGDYTRLSGSCMTDQTDHAFTRLKQILLQPTFPADDFDKLKNQTISQLIVARENPSTVATHELARQLFGQTPLGRQITPESFAGITLEDIGNFYKSIYKPTDAVLMLAGDIDPDRGRQLAETLLADWAGGDLPSVDYTLPPAGSRQIVLVDNPAGKQSVLRVGLRAYDNRNDERFAGSVAGQILSAGIESRLGKYVRAEKGYVYGIAAYFQPGRHAGQFSGFTETAFDTTADTIQAMFKVFEDLRSADVTADELSSAKTRVAGSLVMETQTIEQQAWRRVEALLNGYPADYYDKLPARIGQVTASQVRQVMNQYVKDETFNIVVVAPAEKVKDQLSKLGAVEIIPMPAKRPGATTQGSEMMK